MEKRWGARDSQSRTLLYLWHGRTPGVPGPALHVDKGVNGHLLSQAAQMYSFICGGTLDSELSRSEITAFGVVLTLCHRFGSDRTSLCGLAFAVIVETIELFFSTEAVVTHFN